MTGSCTRYRRAVGALLLAALIGCISGCQTSGRQSAGFIDPGLKDTYIPLSDRQWVIFAKWAAAFVIAPGVGVTNDHNLLLLPADTVLARSRDYDLLFFRADGKLPAKVAKPSVGEAVIAYGQGGSDELREARGTIAGLGANVPPRCTDCGRQSVLIFDANAGPGFSGGPVVDARTGAVLGITFGYLDGQATNGGRRMYAYDVDLVMSEMHRLLDNRAR